MQWFWPVSYTHLVEIRVIYDDVGCWKVKDAFFERMRDAGIDVHAFMPVRFPAFRCV